MVIPDDAVLVDAVNRLQQNLFINAPTIAQTAAIRCFDADTLEELEGYVAKYSASRTIILAALQNIPELARVPGRIAPADGGFYVYIDLGDESDGGEVCSCQDAGLGSVALCQQLLEEHHVAFTPGTDFEDPATSLGDRRFRISYAGGIETATKAMERFQRFWPVWMERVSDADATRRSD